MLVFKDLIIVTVVCVGLHFRVATYLELVEVSQNYRWMPLNFMSFACSQRWLCQWYMKIPYTLCLVCLICVSNMRRLNIFCSSYASELPYIHILGYTLSQSRAIRIITLFSRGDSYKSFIWFRGASQPQKPEASWGESPSWAPSIGVGWHLWGEFPWWNRHHSWRIHGTNDIFTDPWMVDFWWSIKLKYASPMDPMGRVTSQYHIKVSIWVCGKWCSWPSLDLMEPLGRKPFLLLMIYPAVVGQGCRIEQ